MLHTRRRRARLAGLQIRKSCKPAPATSHTAHRTYAQRGSRRRSSSKESRQEYPAATRSTEKRMGALEALRVDIHHCRQADMTHCGRGGAEQPAGFRCKSTGLLRLGNELGPVAPAEAEQRRRAE